MSDRAVTVEIAAPSAVDIDRMHEALRDAYWCRGIPRDVVARACAHSMCALARDAGGELIGFARLVTDRASFAWLCDVWVWESHRGRGVGRALVTAFLEHPQLQGLRRWLLRTRDAHGVYAPLGFAPVPDAGGWMEIRAANPYGAEQAPE